MYYFTFFFFFTLLSSPALTPGGHTTLNKPLYYVNNEAFTRPPRAGVNNIK